jgi:hypothetical protein
MTQEAITSVLRALATGEKARSETARLRDVFDDVEAALRSGVRRETVLKALQEQGFKMKMASFKSALERIRKERKEASPDQQPGKPPLHTESFAAPPAPAKEEAGSAPSEVSDTPKKILNPGDLRKAQRNQSFSLDDYTNEE